jgi:hypothetical protein
MFLVCRNELDLQEKTLKIRNNNKTEHGRIAWHNKAWHNVAWHNVHEFNTWGYVHGPIYIEYKWGTSIMSRAAWSQYLYV